MPSSKPLENFNSDVDWACNCRTFDWAPMICGAGISPNHKKCGPKIFRARLCRESESDLRLRQRARCRFTSASSGAPKPSPHVEALRFESPQYSILINQSPHLQPQLQSQQLRQQLHRRLRPTLACGWCACCSARLGLEEHSMGFTVAWGC